MEKDTVTKKLNKNDKKIIKYYEGKTREGAEVVEVIKEMNTEMDPTTVRRRIKFLAKDEWKLRNITSPGGNQKYILSNIAPPAKLKELQFLKKYYNDAWANNNKKRMKDLREQIETVCTNKRVSYKVFITFLIEKGKTEIAEIKEEVKEKSRGVQTFRKCWGDIVNNLIKSNKEYNSILIMIYEDTTKFLRTIILDEKRETPERYDALDILKKYDYSTKDATIRPEKFDVAFILLGKPTTYLTEDYPSFIRTVKNLILLYASINSSLCEGKLTTLLNTTDNEKIKEAAFELLNAISKE